MFIGRFFITRRLALLIGGALVAALAGVGFLAMTVLGGQGAESAGEIPSPSTPTAPGPNPSPGASNSAIPNPSLSPTGTAVPSESESSGQSPSAQPDSPSGRPSQYPIATEFLNEIVLPTADTPEEQIVSAASTMWGQVLLLAQTNARPGRITETDLAIIAARLKGISWDPVAKALNATINEQQYTMYICLPNGPQETICAEVIEPS